MVYSVLLGSAIVVRSFISTESDSRGVACCQRSTALQNISPDYSAILIADIRERCYLLSGRLKAHAWDAVHQRLDLQQLRMALCPRYAVSGIDIPSNCVSLRPISLRPCDMY